MFTGLVEEVGTIISIETNIRTEQKYKKIRIQCNKICRRISIGDSINVNGACQTVVAHSGVFSRILHLSQWIEIESLHMTLEKTNFSQFKIGTQVNLERALRISDRLGGHIVTGHVQSIAVVDRVDTQHDNTYVYIQCHEDIQAYLVQEGSITIDGISLTIAKVDKNIIMCNIIEHTLQHTTMHLVKKGDIVNIECDILYKYAYNVLQYSRKNTS